MPRLVVLDIEGVAITEVGIRTLILRPGDEEDNVCPVLEDIRLMECFIENYDYANALADMILSRWNNSSADGSRSSRRALRMVMIDRDIAQFEDISHRDSIARCVAEGLRLDVR